MLICAKYNEKATAFMGAYVIADLFLSKYMLHVD